MRLAAVVGVIDEVELIEGCIEHLMQIGVERVLVFDRGSTDGTLELAAGLAKTQPVDIHRSSLEEPHGADIASGIQLTWARDVGADWVLFLDADEKWIVATGRLDEHLELAKADVVSVRRFNVVVTAEGPRIPTDITSASLESLDLFVEPRQVPAEADIGAPDVRWIRAAPMAKVAVRPTRVAAIAPGQHGGISGDGTVVTPDEAEHLLIAHLPFTTFERFERKARNVAETIRRHPDYFEGLQGWHWRRWAGLSEEGLRKEFDAQLVDEREVSALRERGSIRSAAELFRAWVAD